MEGEEIFGSCKWKLNLPPKSKWDSHKHNHVNFSRPYVHTKIGKSHLQNENLRYEFFIYSYIPHKGFSI
jgi:hypothetical protein